MIYKPKYKELSNSQISDTGLEYFRKSKRAFSIVRLINHDTKQAETKGFLFKEVKSIIQLPKTEENAATIGIDIGMLHFLYTNIEGDSYVIHSDKDFLIIRAESVELVNELEYM